MQRYKKCRKPNHSLMHIAPPILKYEQWIEEKPGKNDTAVESNHGNVVKFTCWVKIEGPDWSTTQVTALLDFASLTSFIAERLIQSLRLALRNHSVKISHTDATVSQPSLRGISLFQMVKGKWYRSKRWYYQMLHSIFPYVLSRWIRGGSTWADWKFLILGWESLAM